jgi:hypothetical protein
MKTLIVVAIRCSLLFLVPSLIYGSSAQWDLDPSSGDWNTADNWTPNGVPNGPADVATFGLSNRTDVSISEDTEVNSIIFTSAATNPYNITISDSTLTISGVGITNNAATGFDGQKFRTGDFDFLGHGQIRFTNSSTAGNVFIENDGFGSTNFFDRSTAGSAFIDNEVGSTSFFNRSTAGQRLHRELWPSELFREIHCWQRGDF